MPNVHQRGRKEKRKERRTEEKKREVRCCGRIWSSGVMGVRGTMVPKRQVQGCGQPREGQVCGSSAGVAMATGGSSVGGGKGGGG